jgi:hypothetical protein
MSAFGSEIQDDGGGLFRWEPVVVKTDSSFLTKRAIQSTSIAAGVGVSWGDGTLRFKGKQYRFSIDGLTLVDVGISKASAVGDVYNLTGVSNFEGTYVAGEAGFALVGGMGGMSLRNQNGVVMHLRSVTHGAKLQLGPAGLTIKLKQ